MKKIILLVLLSYIFSQSSIAQVVQTEEDHKVGAGFVSLYLDVNPINGKAGLYTSGGGGFIIKDMRLGIFFSGLSSKVKIKNKETNNETLFSNSYGGLWFGYPLWKTKPFHAYADIKLYVGSTGSIDATTKERTGSNLYFGVTPSIGAEYYIGSLFAIALGVYYKYGYFPNTLTLHDKSLLNQPGVYIALKLGVFQ